LQHPEKRVPMNKLINTLLKVLKEHVSQNNFDIKSNQDEIEKMFSENPSQILKLELDNKYALNKQLLDENSDFINMQLELTDFLKKYRHLFPEATAELQLNQSDQNESQKLFAQTVNGKLKFDKAHPQYNNPLFFKNLLKYYEVQENYEMCEKLLKLRSS